MKHSVLVLALVAATAGCGGGSAAASRPIHVEYRLSASPTYSSPLAPGAHAVITVQEARCSGPLNQFGQAGDLTCDPSTAPHALAATVDRGSNGTTCGLTVAVVSPSQLDATKTGPGDPLYTYYGKTGWCVVELSDPTDGGLGLLNL